MYAVTDLEQLLEFLFGREINLDHRAKYKHNCAKPSRNSISSTFASAGTTDGKRDVYLLQLKNNL